MKVVILAGGYGTRLGKLTRLKPKPMVDVCGKPIIEHIINIISPKGALHSFILYSKSKYNCNMFYK